MEIKKSEKASLESKKRIFREIGYIVVLLILFGAFEFTTKPTATAELTGQEQAAEEEEFMEVTRDEEVKPPEEIKAPEPEPPQDPEIEETENQDEDQSDAVTENNDNQDAEIEEFIFEEPTAVKEEIFQRVEKMPSFPGGDKALMRFLGDNLVYPQDAADLEQQGVVVIRFVVNKDGKAVKPEVMKSVSASLDQAAIDVVRKLPTFTPGEQAGKKVQVYYMLPVRFQLGR